MEKVKREAVRQRALKIKKSQKPKLSTKDYLQRALVVFIILLILSAAMFIYKSLGR
jgi:hypothetical protein